MSRILVVDDSWLIRQTVTNYLKRAGHEVIIGENGTQAIEICTKNNPDCMILDLLMPDISGIDVIKAVREQKIQVPIIILTADIQITTQERCKSVGATDFLIKPPNEEHLIYKLNKALGSKVG